MKARDEWTIMNSWRVVMEGWITVQWAAVKYVGCNRNQLVNLHTAEDLYRFRQNGSTTRRWCGHYLLYLLSLVWCHAPSCFLLTTCFLLFSMTEYQANTTRRIVSEDTTQLTQRVKFSRVKRFIRRPWPDTPDCSNFTIRYCIIFLFYNRTCKYWPSMLICMHIARSWVVVVFVKH